MVLLLKDWEDLKDYIQRFPQCEIIYKADSLGEDTVRLRILAGRFGADFKFKEGDPLFDSILKFLDERGAKPIMEQRDDQTFFL